MSPATDAAAHAELALAQEEAKAQIEAMSSNMLAAKAAAAASAGLGGDGGEQEHAEARSQAEAGVSFEASHQAAAVEAKTKIAELEALLASRGWRAAGGSGKRVRQLKSETRWRKSATLPWPTAAADPATRVGSRRGQRRGGDQVRRP